MPFMVAAVVVVGVLAMLDLTLTFGVIRRLREHTELLSAKNPAPALRVGETVGAFHTSTVDGGTVSRELITDETVVAFFSPTCQPCKEKMPAFVRYAQALDGGRERVLAVVVGDADQAGDFVAGLSPAAQVVVESHDGAVSSAFQVKAYPTMLVAAPGADGRVLVRADHVDLDRPSVLA